MPERNLDIIISGRSQNQNKMAKCTICPLYRNQQNMWFNIYICIRIYVYIFQHIIRTSRNTVRFSYSNDKTYRTRLFKKRTVAEIPNGHSAMTAITEIIFHAGTLKF